MLDVTVLPIHHASVDHRLDGESPYCSVARGATVYKPGVFIGRRRPMSSRSYSVSGREGAAEADAQDRDGASQ